MIKREIIYNNFIENGDYAWFIIKLRIRKPNEKTRSTYEK